MEVSAASLNNVLVCGAVVRLVSARMLQAQNDPIIEGVQPGGAAQVAGVAAGSVVLACMNVACAGRGQQGLIGIVKQQPPTQPIVLVLSPPQPNWQANVPTLKR